MVKINGIRNISGKILLKNRIIVNVILNMNDKTRISKNDMKKIFFVSSKIKKGF